MFRLAFSILLILVGCTSKAKAPVNQGKSWRESFPANKPDQSGELYTYLKSANAPIEKTADQHRLRAYDLTCLLHSNSEKYDCTFRTSPDHGLKFRVGSTESEKLANLLFGLPVSQGDSGASTRFVECVHFAPQEKSQPTCTVAIELDYVGP